MNKLEYEMPSTAYVTETAEGVLIEKGPDLFIPVDDFEKIDAIAAENEAAKAAGKSECQQCGEWFEPRRKSGGKPQKYCGEPCRREADAERKANAPKADQRESGFTLHPTSMAARHIGLAQTPPEAESDGCWFMDNPEHVVLPTQEAVALYWNEADDLVTRQERSWCDDRDHVVIIQRDNVDAFIDKLSDMAGMPSIGKS